MLYEVDAELTVINPAGTSALLVGGPASAPTGYLFDTSTNTVGPAFPVPPGVISAAFTPDGTSIWFTSLGEELPSNLIGEAFPGGAVIGQLQTDAAWIAFQP